MGSHLFPFSYKSSSVAASYLNESVPPGAIQRGANISEFVINVKLHLDSSIAFIRGPIASFPKPTCQEMAVSPALEEMVAAMRDKQSWPML